MRSGLLALAGIAAGVVASAVSVAIAAFVLAVSLISAAALEIVPRIKQAKPPPDYLSPNALAQTNRNDSLIDLVNLFASRATPLLSEDNPGSLVEKHFYEARDRLAVKAHWSTGEERLAVESFQGAANRILILWRKAETHDDGERSRALRNLRELQSQTANALRVSGESTTTYDRTDWLPRIRALLRAQRDEGHSLIRCFEEPDHPMNVFTTLERWFMHTADLILDAYGPSARYDFRNELGSTGYRAFEPPVKSIGGLIEQAGQLRLLDTFRFEDWETKQ